MVRLGIKGLRVSDGKIYHQGILKNKNWKNKRKFSKTLTPRYFNAELVTSSLIHPSIDKSLFYFGVKTD